MLYEADDDLLAERHEHDVAAGAAVELHGREGGGGWRGEEVVDGLVVDLEVRAAQEELTVGRRGGVREDVAQRARDDAGLGGVTRGREDLARAGLPVGEDDGVEAVYEGVHVGACGGGVDGGVCGTGVHGVEDEGGGGGGGLGVLWEARGRAIISPSGGDRYSTAERKKLTEIHHPRHHKLT